MKNKFISVYIKFILAAGFCMLTYMAYVKHYTLSVKVILLLVVAVAWAILGTRNLLQWKKQVKY